MTYPWLAPVENEFAERLKGSRLAHALLLSGPAGTGKLELATGLVASLLCLENRHPACGNCRSCQLLSTGAHPDRHLITFEEHPRTGDLRREIVIGQVRRLIAALFLTNTISQRKAALIHPAESMNINTANALLKTLEEPSGDAVLILVSHDPARLPATIRSRCQNLHVRVPATEQALTWLGEQGHVDTGEARLALNAAAGSPLGARSMLKNGTVEQYRLVLQTLEDLREGKTDPGRAMAELGEVDPTLLWSWLSLHAAARLKAAMATGQASRELSRLQSGADQGRKLLPTPVRKDFLLQDWLIQWARLNA